MTDWPGLHTWYVVFEPTTSAWWGRFLARGFGHCWMLGFDTRAGVWVEMEPLFSGTVVRVAPDEVVRGVFIRHRRGEVRLLRVRHIGAEVRWPRLVVTCAGAVASLLGMRRFPLTPYGLFWRLRRLGAQEIERGGEDEDTGTGGEDGGGASGGAGCRGCEAAGGGPVAA